MKDDVLGRFAEHGRTQTKPNHILLTDHTYPLLQALHGRDMSSSGFAGRAQSAATHNENAAKRGGSEMWRVDETR